MARLGVGGRGVGLDVGTDAVRAVELRAGHPATMVRVGQVPLPRGAVRNGEVEDVGAVADAILRLWKRPGFSTRVVRIGVSNQRVVSRQLIFPAMSREDLRTSVPYQAQEHIPLPLAESVVDFDVVEEMIGPDGTPEQTVMVVAAHRQMLDRLLKAVQEAKLEPDACELNAYPLLRALPTESVLADTSEAVLDIGAGLTNIVIHEGGKLRFARPQVAGGDDFTQSLVASMGLDWDAAEAVKVRAGPFLAARLDPSAAAIDAAEPDEQVEHALSILEPQVIRFADEIRNTLDFYLTQPETPSLGRVMVTGGGSLLGGQRERQSTVLRTDVEQARAYGRIRLGKMEIAPEQVGAAEPFFAVAVGLALGALER